MYPSTGGGGMPPGMNMGMGMGMGGQSPYGTNSQLPMTLPMQSQGMGMGMGMSPMGGTVMSPSMMATMPMSTVPLPATLPYGAPGVPNALLPPMVPGVPQLNPQQFDMMTGMPLPPPASPFPVTASVAPGGKFVSAGQAVEATVVADYNPPNPYDMSKLRITTGQQVTVLSREDEGWWYGRLRDGKEGYFPSAFVTVLSSVVAGPSFTSASAAAPTANGNIGSLPPVTVVIQPPAQINPPPIVVQPPPPQMPQQTMMSPMMSMNNMGMQPMQSQSQMQRPPTGQPGYNTQQAMMAQQNGAAFGTQPYGSKAIQGGAPPMGYNTQQAMMQQQNMMMGGQSMGGGGGMPMPQYSALGQGAPPMNGFPPQQQMGMGMGMY